MMYNGEPAKATGAVRTHDEAQPTWADTWTMEFTICHDLSTYSRNIVGVCSYAEAMNVVRDTIDIVTGGHVNKIQSLILKRV